jgi:hypothetical protein
MSFALRPALVTAVVGLAQAKPAAAHADSRVNVQVVDSVGRPMDGTVTFTGPVVRSCRTVAARCSLDVPAGLYTATLVPVRERPNAPQPVTVRPGGVAQVVLRSAPGSPQMAPVIAAPCVSPGTGAGDVEVDVTVYDSFGRPTDGTVTLTGQTIRSCRTVTSRCSLRAPPGNYTASLSPVREEPPAPIPFVVPAPCVPRLVLRSATRKQPGASGSDR